MVILNELSTSTTTMQRVHSDLKSAYIPLMNEPWASDYSVARSKYMERNR